MSYVQIKWFSKILLGIGFLLGFGGGGLLFSNEPRSLDCPDPGIFIDPDSTTTPQMRVIEPPTKLDPGMIYPPERNCGEALPPTSDEG